MSEPIPALNSMLKTLEDRAEAFNEAEAITPVLTVVDGHVTTTSLDTVRSVILGSAIYCWVFQADGAVR